MKQNYQLVLDQTIQKLQGENRVPRLLLHSCCAPCSSYVLEYLSNYFYITVFYYNPNIYPDEEYQKRVWEQQRFIESLPTKYPIDFVEGDFEKDLFFEKIKGLEQEPEGADDVRFVSDCAWKRQRHWQRRWGWIILPPPYPSAP